ncbi:MAG: cellulose biosynthesis cyclic di-GMP-binding regulatory protein BcsB [Pseudomonadota bacterium]
MKHKMNFIRMLLLSACCLTTGSFAIEAYSPTDKAVFAKGYPEAAPTTTHEFTFEQLNQDSIRLSGVLPNSDLNFTNRIDKIIKELSLKLKHTNSPALLSKLSHIKVYLNDQLMAIVPVTPLAYDKVHQTLSEQTLKLKPHLVRNYNTIRFELIGHYTNEYCEDSTHSSIWAELDKDSMLKYKAQQIALKSDLAHFPEPFFDEFDYNKLSLPIIFASRPSKTTTPVSFCAKP